MAVPVAGSGAGFAKVMYREESANGALAAFAGKTKPQAPAAQPATGPLPAGETAAAPALPVIDADARRHANSLAAPAPVVLKAEAIAGAAPYVQLGLRVIPSVFVGYGAWNKEFEKGPKMLLKVTK